jgi:hypothetical protein
VKDFFGFGDFLDWRDGRCGSVSFVEVCWAWKGGGRFVRLERSNRSGSLGGRSCLL